jgi:hypothetical protein
MSALLDWLLLRLLRAVPSILSLTEPKKPPPSSSFVWIDPANGCQCKVDVYLPKQPAAQLLPIHINLQGVPRNLCFPSRCERAQALAS